MSSQAPHHAIKYEVHTKVFNKWYYYNFEFTRKSQQRGVDQQDLRRPLSLTQCIVLHTYIRVCVVCDKIAL